jgi:hypothetical protein
MSTVQPDSNRFSFLLLGAGRGGTSLLAGLLDSHPDLEVGFELFAFEYLMGRGMPENLTGSTRTMLQDRTRLFREACEETASRSDRKMWGNKITTEQLVLLHEHTMHNLHDPMNELDYFFRTAMAGVKIIFILRDGRACVQSKVRRTGQPMENACKRWQYSVEVYQYLAQESMDALTLKFEDLVQAPHPTLKRICDYLDIPFDPRMLEGTSSDKMLPEYRSDSLNPEKAEPVLLPHPYNYLIREDLALCGYPE